MEGASVAQVSFQEKIPCIVIRTISDSADSNAALSFEEFLNIYKYESWNLIETLLKNFKEISNSYCNTEFTGNLNFEQALRL